MIKRIHFEMLRDWLEETGEKIQGLFRRKKRRKKKDPLAGPKVLCWIIILALLSFCIFLVAQKEIGWSLITLGCLGAFIHWVLHEIKTPEHAFVFRKGVMVGEIGPGWHWTVEPIWKIRIISKALQRIDLNPIEMYKKDGTRITIKRATVFYRYTSLKNAIKLEEGEHEERIKDITLAKLKGQIGQRDFVGEGGLVAEQGDIEEGIAEDLHNEMKKWGCKIEDVEIVDFDEEVHSKAEEIKVLGDAEAQARGKSATAFAEPLKDNYPAAIASSVSALASSAEKITETKAKNAAQKTKEASKTDEEITTILEKVKKIIE